MKSLMIMGTSSSCGKSFVTTASLRKLRHQGYSVAPFKAQNIALNSYITDDHREMAYSTYIQALSAGVVPESDMNPVLIKPGYDKTQIILNGKLVFTGPYTQYRELITDIKTSISDALHRLSQKYDIIIIEGAGSPAEINVTDQDAANVFTAKLTNSPLLLVSDIHYGGVFASINGTIDLLDDTLRENLRGFIVNRYSGDKEVLASGIDFLEKKFSVPCAGILPYDSNIVVPDEDYDFRNNNLTKHVDDHKLNIGIINLPHLSNNTDFYALSQEPAVNLLYIDRPEDILRMDALILPGSKNIYEDYLYLIDHYFRDFLSVFVQNGGYVIGICGGYQMLGKEVVDQYGVEMATSHLTTFGFMDHFTYFEQEKTTNQVEAVCAGVPVRGFEIHHGRTTSNDKAFIVEKSSDRVLGTIGVDGRVCGTYVHDLFRNDNFRRYWIEQLNLSKNITQNVMNPGITMDEHFDAMAELFQKHIDQDLISKLLEISL